MPGPGVQLRTYSSRRNTERAAEREEHPQTSERVRPNRLVLIDAKTGPRYILLEWAARKVLDKLADIASADGIVPPEQATLNCHLGHSPSTCVFAVIVTTPRSLPNARVASGSSFRIRT